MTRKQLDALLDGYQVRPEDELEFHVDADGHPEEIVLRGDDPVVFKPQETMVLSNYDLFICVREKK